MGRPKARAATRDQVRGPGGIPSVPLAGPGRVALAVKRSARGDPGKTNSRGRGPGRPRRVSRDHWGRRIWGRRLTRAGFAIVGGEQAGGAGPALGPIVIVYAPTGG